MNVRSFVYSSVCSISEASQSGINCYVCFKENNEKKKKQQEEVWIILKCIKQYGNILNEHVVNFKYSLEILKNIDVIN